MAIDAERVELEDCLDGFLRAGLTVCEDTRHFAESALGLSDDETAELLKDQDAEYRDELLRLIFTPSQAMRESVESILCRAVFTDGDSAAVASRLAGRCPEVMVRFCESGRAVSISEISGSISGMIDRLAVSKTLDEEICTALVQHVEPRRAIAARVVLRMAPARFSDETRELMCRFLERAHEAGSCFEHMFGRLVVLAGELSPGGELEDHLFVKRRQLAKTLQDLDEFSQRQDQYGLEYLLMHRYPVPHESEETVRGELALLDRLMFHVLQLDVPPDVRLCFSTPEDVSGRPQIEELLRSLS